MTRFSSQNLLHFFCLLAFLCFTLGACDQLGGVPRATTPTNTSAPSLDVHMSMIQIVGQSAVTLSMQFYASAIPVVFQRGETVQCENILLAVLSNGGYKDELYSKDIPYTEQGYTCVYTTQANSTRFHLPPFPKVTISTPQNGTTVPRQENISITYSSPNRGMVQASAGNEGTSSGGLAPTVVGDGTNFVAFSEGPQPATGAITIQHGLHLHPGSGRVSLNYADQVSPVDSTFRSFRLDVQITTQIAVFWT